MLPDSWEKVESWARKPRSINVLVQAKKPRYFMPAAHVSFNNSLKCLEKLISRSHSDLTSAQLSIPLVDKSSLEKPTYDSKERRKAFQRSVKELNAVKMRLKRALHPIPIVKGLSRLEAMLPKTQVKPASDADILFNIVHMPGIRQPQVARDLPASKPLRSTLKAESTVSTFHPRIQSLPTFPELVQLRRASRHTIIVPPGKTYGPCECSQKVFRQCDLHYRVMMNGPGREVPKLTPVFVGVSGEEDQRLVLAIAFTGVIGDIWKRNLHDTSPKELCFRKNVVLGLQWLQQTFRLVLLSPFSLPKTHRLLSHLNSIDFAAVYTYPSPSPVLDYSNLQQDLQVPYHRLLVVSSVDMPWEEIDGSEEALYVRAGTKVKLMASALPAPRTSPPVVLLVPSIRAQEAHEVMPFDQIAGYIYAMRTKSDWHASFYALSPHLSPEFFTLTTGLGYEAMASTTRPHPKAKAIRNSAERCPQHESVLWAPVDVYLKNEVVILKGSAHTGGLDVLEVKALSVASGFLNLLSYTCTETSH